ncbi:hypothetical protein [Streptomyces sp. NBC_00887]|uniref:hypothetical protein n=1 Tax=Streptomyces sp. NBC_00887 TaxID=2975859 RepID=UPI003869065F|nr:hypothetical protein OG844_00075 [Streptomyces sp. NBC_00887]WSY36392.1 hypothetical protein OG844_45520 [Streptomyces sp. NBC_00887]
MTPPTTLLTRPGPVPVIIGLRPRAGAAGALPVPLNVSPIGDDEIRIIADLDEAAEAAECSCSAGDDQPY